MITSVAELRQRRLESEDIELRVEDQSKQHVLAVLTELQQVVLNFVVNAEQAIVDVRPAARAHHHSDPRRRRPRDPRSRGHRARAFRPTTRPSCSSRSSRPSRSARAPASGLSVSYGIIDSLGGRIGYRRAPAGGAIFYFDLPAASAGAA